MAQDPQTGQAWTMAYVPYNVAAAMIAEGFAPATGSVGTPGTSPPSPQLQAFLDAIPFANDGDVITADHHNTIRQALAAIARSLDETQLARAVTSSFTPALLPAEGATPWRSGVGFALGPPSGPAEGWMPLDLPNGTLIDTLVVRGKMPQLANEWIVSLRRVELTSELEVDVCKAEIPNRTAGSPESFEFPAPVITDGVTPVQVAERRRVDNARYRYLFYTKLESQNGPDLHEYELRLIQVKSTRG
jgi:hypothetical protein